MADVVRDDINLSLLRVNSKINYRLFDGSFINSSQVLIYFKCSNISDDTILELKNALVHECDYSKHKEILCGRTEQYVLLWRENDYDVLLLNDIFSKSFRTMITTIFYLRNITVRGIVENKRGYCTQYGTVNTDTWPMLQCVLLGSPEERVHFRHSLRFEPFPNIVKTIQKIHFKSFPPPPPPTTENELCINRPNQTFIIVFNNPGPPLNVASLTAKINASLNNVVVFDLSAFDPSGKHLLFFQGPAIRHNIYAFFSNLLNISVELIKDSVFAIDDFGIIKTMLMLRSPLVLRYHFGKKQCRLMELYKRIQSIQP